MVKKLACKDIFYAFSKENEPVLSVEAGTTVEIETYDCFEGQVQTPEDKIAEINWERINPATGPIYIEGAQKGDILKVTIDKLEIADQAVLATGPGLGVMGHRIDAFMSKIVQIEDDHVVFSDKVKVPLNPMIGVIGVAPEGEPVPCGTPGAHGGNMDTKMIAEGATLYFPVFTDGALFGLGDFHAAMGDGEVGGAGAEIAGKATVTFDVIKSHTLKHPLIVNDEGLAFNVSAETLDEAAKVAAQEAIDFLLPFSELTLEEMTSLMSIAGQSKISQIVDPLMTARFFVPKYILEAFNVKIFE